MSMGAYIVQTFLRRMILTLRLYERIMKLISNSRYITNLIVDPKKGKKAVFNTYEIHFDSRTQKRKKGGIYYL
jgi:hypothetical protein